MKILKTIREEEIFDNVQKKDDSEYTKTRDAVRIIVVDDNGKIALNHYKKNENYPGEYGIPGGGADVGESLEEATIREAKEETGCVIESLKEIGIVIEYGVSPNLIQTTYCYTGKVKEKGTPEFTLREQKDELEIEWLSLDEAMQMITENSRGFTKARGVLFLEEYKKGMFMNLI